MSDFFNDLSQIKPKSSTLKSNKVARFSYTQNAYDDDDINGVDTYQYSNDQNVPNDTKTDLDPAVIDKGVRSQSASLPRNAINHFFGRVSYNLNKITDWLDTILAGLLRSEAMNGHRYTSTTQYQQYDVCSFVDPTITPNQVRYFMRYTSDPVSLSGSPPMVNGVVQTTHWRELSDIEASAYSLVRRDSNGSIKGYNATFNNLTLGQKFMGDVDTVDGYHAGNASGQIPVSNGITNTNLLAEKAITAWELKLQTVSASTALQSDVCIVEVTTSDAVTLTIPSGLPVGHQYRIKRTVSSSNGISVARSGSETIEGGTSFTVQGSKVSSEPDTGEVVIEKVSGTAWAFVGGQVYGSNSNGIFIKFSDGTMECFGRSAGSSTEETIPVTFAGHFSSSPKVFASTTQTSGSYDGMFKLQDSVGLDGCTLFHNYFNTGGGTDVCDYRAIGRWRE
jgi:hypothetical protein